MVFIFDYDGTCHETIGIYGEAVRRAEKFANEQGYFATQGSDDRSLEKYLGMTTEDMWDDFMPGAPGELKRSLSLIVQENMVSAIKGDYANLYSGMEELFEELKRRGHTLLILSNCTKKYRDTHWEGFKLSRWFSKFYCSESYGGIPKEDIFQYIAEEFPGRYCMIGDRLADMKVGYIHKFITVACHYGYGSDEELKDADYHAESVMELKTLLLNTVI